MSARYGVRGSNRNTHRKETKGGPVFKSQAAKVTCVFFCVGGGEDERRPVPQKSIAELSCYSGQVRRLRIAVFT